MRCGGTNRNPGPERTLSRFRMRVISPQRPDGRRSCNSSRALNLFDQICPARSHARYSRRKEGSCQPVGRDRQMSNGCPFRTQSLMQSGEDAPTCHKLRKSSPTTASKLELQQAAKHITPGAYSRRSEQGLVQ